MKRKLKNEPADDFYDEFDFERIFIETVKQARIEQGYSQRELAEKVGVEQAAIARFESHRGNPTLTFLKKVLIGLDLQLTVTKSR